MVISIIIIRTEILIIMIIKVFNEILKTLIIMIMEELAIITMITVIKLTCRRNTMEKKNKKQSNKET